MLLQTDPFHSKNQLLCASQHVSCAWCVAGNITTSIYVTDLQNKSRCILVQCCPLRILSAEVSEMKMCTVIQIILLSFSFWVRSSKVYPIRDSIFNGIFCVGFFFCV